MARIRLPVPALASLWLLTVPGAAQISPGPLSKAHNAWNGPTQCATCHSFGIGARKFKCLSCHGEIRQRLKDNHGYHARIVDRSKASVDCVRCHSEHYGLIFNIVKWETTAEEFDHRKTGYPLEGRHAGLACGRCHTSKHISAGERRSIQVKDLTRSYMGLSAQCLTCHADQHRGQLGPDCARCHSVQSWKPASGFDHASSRFPLTGLHQKVDCARCHVRQQAPQPQVQYTGLRFGACTDCHKDPHRGVFQRAAFQGAALQGPCQSCHTTSGWKQVRMSPGFDHGRTAFPLRGKHAAVACLDCHRNSSFAEPVAHARCVDCHKKDPHHGQFLHRADAGDCGGCHHETGFKPALFTLALHQQTDYPLAAKHAAVACEKCHLPAGADTRYRVPHNACLDCHKDVHGAQFAAAPHDNRCEPCHTVEGFRPSTFTLARHNQTRFALNGSHAATACFECHKPPAGRYPPPPAQYRFGSMACTTCHQDPHDSQFAGLKHGSNFAADESCETCHNVKSWKEVTTFDHSATTFPLEGSHRAVACTECHRPANLGKSVRNVVFRGAPTACAGCHEDVHGGQFVSAGQTADCATCHVVMSWKAAAFDHERTQFSLAGAHRAVACRQCHNTRSEIGGRLVVVYKGAPKQCAACHSDQ